MKRTKRYSQTENIYRLISFGSPLFLLLLWEGLVWVNWLDARFFPPPSTVFVVMAGMISSGELWQHLQISLWRVLAGFVVGALPAVALGLLMGWFRPLHAFFDPLIAAIYPVPKIALLPLFLIWFGLGEITKIVTVAVAVFFVVLITTVNGVRLVEPVHAGIAAAQLPRARRAISPAQSPASQQ